MDSKSIIAYLLENERKRYEYAKELQKTLRWAILAILGAITIIACSYMYFVVPAEEEAYEVTNGSQYISESVISGDNTNGK
jgi:hypothetical protein